MADALEREFAPPADVLEAFGSVASAGPAWRRPVRAEAAGPVRRVRVARRQVDRSAMAGFRFPAEVITVAVRWYLRYGLSYRDVEGLLAERGVEPPRQRRPGR